MIIMNTKLKLIFPLLIIIMGTSLVIFFEYQYGSVIPEQLPEEALNEIDDFSKGDLLYNVSLNQKSDIDDWIMEGLGKTEFENGGMKMYSPNKEGNHVLWCNEDFPKSFVGKWRIKNLNTEAGLCIIFFASKGTNGEDIFDDDLAERNGIFEQYTRGDINNYHISYFANPKNEPGREIANMRKNSGFNLVQTGRRGVPIDSEDEFEITLIKDDNHIVLFIDEREVINWVDTGLIDLPVLGEGKIGFRQMKWTEFLYRDFRVWELKEGGEKYPIVVFPIPSLPIIIASIIALIAVSILLYHKLK